MKSSVHSIADVVAGQLCTGCGACAYVEPARFRMGDALEYGRRPFLKEAAAPESGTALAVCPGMRLQHDSALREQPGLIPSLIEGWGPVLGVWEAYAADAEIRFSGSSGGAATALALYAIERAGMSGVLHTAACPGQPYLNETVMSTSRAELLERAGSRYAPSSPLDKLDLVESAANPCVFIGKPCDTAAVKNVRKIRPRLDEKFGLVLAFFCAGVPSTQGNLDLLAANGVSDPSAIKELRYRGKGWPGNWTVRFQGAGGGEQVRQLTYAESWHFLQKYRQWRCYICPDHTGELPTSPSATPGIGPYSPTNPESH